MIYMGHSTEECTIGSEGGNFKECLKHAQPVNISLDGGFVYMGISIILGNH